MPTRDLAKELAREFTANYNLQPQMAAAEAKIRPLWSGVDLGSMESYLLGDTGSPGYLGGETPMSYTRTVGGAGETPDVLTSAPTPGTGGGGYLGLYQRSAPAVRAAWEKANPELASIMSGLNAQATQLASAGPHLDPALRREVEQGVRGSAAARGWGWGPSDAIAEGYAIGDRGRQIRGENMALASGVAGLNKAVVPDALSFLQQAMQAERSAGPGILKPTVTGADLFDWNANSQAAAGIAEANNTNAMAAAFINLLGSIGKGAAAGAMG